MLRGIFKYLLHLFLGSIFMVFVGQTEAHSNSHTHSIIRHDVNISCAENAVAPLNSIKDIQTFLNCNGFNPGPIDGRSGGRTTSAIKSFQATVGLTADGVVGPATRQAMRSYSTVSFTFTGSGWGHGVGLSQYGTKGLTELGAQFCSNTSSCSSDEVVSYYFQGTNVKNLGDISLSSPEIASSSNSLWVGLARNAKNITLTTLPSSSPPTLNICQDGLSNTAGVQLFLTSRGYDPGPIDGAYGDRTANAIRNYQSSVGLGQTGAIDDELINKIKSDATADGPGESIWGPLKIGGGATVNIINSGSECYLTGHPLVPKIRASCNMSVKWSDGGRIRVGPREHKHGILKLRSKNVSSGFHVVLAVNLEKYLYGLAEMPSHWNVKALEAQALVGRSYAVFHYLDENIPASSTNIDAGLSEKQKAYCWCHIGSTASSQYYYGYLKEISGPNWVQAVNNTSGKVITYDGSYTRSSVIQAFYSSSTGGKTNTNVVGFGSATPWPYLKTVDDPWSIDNRVGNSKAAWSFDFNTYQLSKNILCGDTPCFDAITDIYVSSVAESGAALEVTMKGFKNGSAKSVTKSGRNIKSQLGFRSHYFKTSSTSDVSNLAVGPVQANTSSGANGASESLSAGETAQYATSSAGLSYLAKAGVINKCDGNSSGCQAKTLTREEAAAIVTVVGGIPQDSPNAYSDDDQSIYQSAINGLPYYGMQVCFGSPFEILPKETVSRDEFACLLVRSIASYIIDKLVGKSLISTNLFDSSPFNNAWKPSGGEVQNVAETAVSNPNAGNDACVPKDNSGITINSVLDVQQFLSNNGFNPGPIDGQSGPKTKAAIKAFQQKAGLYADGIVGNKTKAGMKAYTGCESGNVCKARNNSGAKLDSVEGVQTFLANNGFNPGIIDGEMGSYTREAIKAFQRKVGLIPDGVAGTRTKAAMKSYTGC